MKPNRKILKFLLTLLVVALPCASELCAQTTVYTNNDGSTGTFSGGATGTATGGTQSTSPSSEVFREIFNGNDTFTVTIAGLAPNSGFSLSLDLYAIRSVDGNGPYGGNSPSNPDLFTITANSSNLLNASFDNYLGDTGQTYPSMYAGPTGIVNNPAGTGSTAENTLGYTFNNSIGDATYALSYSGSADASGTLTLTFHSTLSESEDNESFGVDNISVSGTVAAVPEPTTWALMLGGLGTLVAFQRTRSRHFSR